MDLIAHGLAGGGVMMTGVYMAILLNGAGTSDDALSWVKILGELPLTGAMLIGIIYAAKEMRKFISDRDAKMKEITEAYTEALDNMSEKHDASTMALVHRLKALELQQATNIEILRNLTTEVASLQSHIQSCDAVQEVRRQHPHSHPHQHPQHHQIKPQP